MVGARSLMPACATPACLPGQILHLLDLYRDHEFLPSPGSPFSRYYLAAAEAETDFVYRCTALWTSQALMEQDQRSLVWQYSWDWCDGSCTEFIRHGAENR